MEESASRGGRRRTGPGKAGAPGGSLAAAPGDGAGGRVRAGAEVGLVFFSLVLTPYPQLKTNEARVSVPEFGELGRARSR